MEWLTQPQAWIALATLTVPELVLGIDNIVFLTILAGKLPAAQRAKARRIGLALAMLTRIALLLSLAWLIGLTAPWFALFGHEVSGRDVILILGGLFLLAKSTHEIHQKLEGHESELSARAAPSFTSVIVQIILLDVIFSLDSVITAVGMVEQVQIMVIAIVIAIGLMMVFARPIGDFVDRHPTVKILALSFLLLIGTALIADGAGMHIPRGYIYFAMGFSVMVELINLRAQKVAGPPVQLHEQFIQPNPAADSAGGG
jgi:predicted tellurium resistance membrane protein TerC